MRGKRFRKKEGLRIEEEESEENKRREKMEEGKRKVGGIMYSEIYLSFL